MSIIYSIVYFLVLCILVLLNGCTTFQQHTKNIEKLIFIQGKDSINPKSVERMIRLTHNRLAWYSQPNLMIAKGKTIITSIQINGLQAMVEYSDTLFIGTDKGMIKVSLATYRQSKTPIPARDSSPSITSLVTDINNRLWIATNGFGLFSYLEGNFKPEKGTQYASSLAVTPDSSIWVGTDIGLLRIVGDTYSRYTEEIAAVGIALQDNLINYLHTDNEGRLWICMADAVSIVPLELSKGGLEQHVEPPTFDFIGFQGNRIYKIAQRSTEKVWWMATDGGLFLVENMAVESHDHTHNGLEGRHESNGSVRKIRFQFGEKGHFTRVNDILFDQLDNLLVATTNGIWKISPKGLELLLEDDVKPKTSLK